MQLALHVAKLDIHAAELDLHGSQLVRQLLEHLITMGNKQRYLIRYVRGRQL